MTDTDIEFRTRLLGIQFPHSVAMQTRCVNEAIEMYDAFLARLAEVEKKAVELADWKLRLTCPMVQPSCLLCGQQRELEIKHLEVKIGICGECRTAQAEHARLREEVEDAKRLIGEADIASMRLRQQLAAAQGVWSTERPTKAGWYWYRMTPAPEHWEVCRVTGKDILTAHFTDGQVEPVSLIQGEWGPTPLPRERA